MGAPGEVAKEKLKDATVVQRPWAEPLGGYRRSTPEWGPCPYFLSMSLLTYCCRPRLATLSEGVMGGFGGIGNW